MCRSLVHDIICVFLYVVFSIVWVFFTSCPPVEFWTSAEFLQHPSGLDLFLGSHVPECGTYITFQGSV